LLVDNFPFSAFFFLKFHNAQSKISELEKSLTELNNGKQKIPTQTLHQRAQPSETNKPIFFEALSLSKKAEAKIAKQSRTTPETNTQPQTQIQQQEKNAKQQHQEIESNFSNKAKALLSSIGETTNTNTNASEYTNINVKKRKLNNDKSENINNFEWKEEILMNTIDHIYEMASLSKQDILNLLCSGENDVMSIAVMNVRKNISKQKQNKIRTTK
jgi:hypothetical protein